MLGVRFTDHQKICPKIFHKHARWLARPMAAPPLTIGRPRTLHSYSLLVVDFNCYPFPVSKFSCPPKRTPVSGERCEFNSCSCVTSLVPYSLYWPRRVSQPSCSVGIAFLYIVSERAFNFSVRCTLCRRGAMCWDRH